MFFFSKKKPVADFQVNLKKTGNKVTYGEVVGYFEFRNEIYYKVKGSSGRNVKDLEKPFTAKIKELYPDEFKDYLAKDIRSIIVNELIVM